MISSRSEGGVMAMAPPQNEKGGVSYTLVEAGEEAWIGCALKLEVRGSMALIQIKGGHVFYPLAERERIVGLPPAQRWRRDVYLDYS